MTFISVFRQPFHSQHCLNVTNQTKLIKKPFIILCLNLFITFSLFCQDRAEIIRGVTIDSGSGKKIANVKIYPDYQNDTVYSGSSGKFKIRVSSHFRDNIYFEHPDYYQYLHNIKFRSNLYLQRIELITDTLALDTIFYPTFERIRCIEGRVYDLQTRIPVDKAKIELDDKKIIGYSDRTGFYKLCIPESIDTLIVRQNDYYPYILTIKNLKDVLMEPLLPRVDLDTCFGEKNSVRLVINELFTGAVGIDYERFLRVRHSIGLKSSFYLFYNDSPSGKVFVPTAIFKGIKFSPYYRFYAWRNNSNGGFFEGKISWGYFDFEEIYYKGETYGFDPRTNGHISKIFRSVGFGASYGWMCRFRKSPLILNVSFGLQYFPLNVPRTVQFDVHFDDYTVRSGFWNYGGPGSVLEIKFMIGGIF